MESSSDESASSKLKGKPLEDNSAVDEQRAFSAFTQPCDRARRVPFSRSADPPKRRSPTPSKWGGPPGRT
eukprot:scaffold35916_cov68-Phaeocystis_antarctica.AAC.5